MMFGNLPSLTKTENTPEQGCGSGSYPAGIVYLYQDEPDKVQQTGRTA